MDGTWIFAVVSVAAVVYFALRLVRVVRARSDQPDTDKVTKALKYTRQLACEGAAPGGGSPIGRPHSWHGREAFAHR